MKRETLDAFRLWLLCEVDYYLQENGIGPRRHGGVEVRDSASQTWEKFCTAMQAENPAQREEER